MILFIILSICFIAYVFRNRIHIIDKCLNQNDCIESLHLKGIKRTNSHLFNNQRLFIDVFYYTNDFGKTFYYDYDLKLRANALITRALRKHYKKLNNFKQKIES